jgi:hypothetical protein
MEQSMDMDAVAGEHDTAGADVLEIQQDARAGLTVEHALYLVVLLAAFGLRFINLGAAPLIPLEAAQSWPAWLAATGTVVLDAPAPLSALFYGLQSLLFFLTGANDLLARLLPALLGTALVLLPWWWRDWLGPGGALVAALLLAIDPWLAALARTADGVGLTIFLGMLALTSLWRWCAASPPMGGAESRGARWERVLAVALGLLLVSGPQAWSWLPVLALFAWFYLFVPARHGGGMPPRPQRASFLWFGAALVLGASGLLARPEAINAVGTSLTAWLEQWQGDFGAGAEPYLLGSGWPFLRLLVDQLLLVVFGLAGLVLLAAGHGLPPDADAPDNGSAARAGRRLALFLGLWLVWGLVLSLLPGRSPYVLPMLGLPLLLAAAAALGYLLAFPLRGVNGIEVAILLVVAAVLVIAGSVWLAMVVESFAYDTRLIITAALLLALIALVWVAFGFWAGWQVAGKLAGLFLAAVLLLVSVRSAWTLSHLGGQMTPNGFFPVTTLPEARLLPLDVQRISSLRSNDPYEIPIQIVTAGRPPDPLVNWLLRDMRHIAYVTTPTTGLQTDDESAVLPVGTVTPLVVAPYAVEQERSLAGLIGARYPLTMRWEPSQLPALPEPDAAAAGLPAEELARLRADQAWSQATRPALEWLLYRMVRTAPAVDGVTLWAAP